MAWESSRRGDIPWTRAELPTDTKPVPIHISPGMHPSAQEARTGPMSQLTSLYVLSTSDSSCIEKPILGLFSFHLADFQWECMYHHGNTISPCSGKKEEILAEFSRSSFYPNLTKHFSLPVITNLSTQKLQIQTFEVQILLPLLALRTLPLITTVKSPCVSCWSHSFTWAEIYLHCRIFITTFKLE